MAKIYIDNKLLENKLLLDANNALNELKKSIYDVGNISVPYEFEYSEYVKKIFDKNLKTYNELDKRIKDIKMNVETLDSIEKDNIGIIDDIKMVDITYRKNIIN